MNPITTDRLIDPKVRTISTVFTTAMRADEGTYDAGTVRVAVTTSHDRDLKRIETRVNREVRTDDGVIRRSFRIYSGPSADAGITLAKEPCARFSAKRAAEMHGFVVDNLELMLTHDGSEVARELLDLLALTSVVA